MDEGGVGRHILLARKMMHYPDDDSTDLEQPRLINTEPGKAGHASEGGRGENDKQWRGYLSERQRHGRAKWGQGAWRDGMTTSLLH